MMKNRILFALLFCLSFYMVDAQALLSNDGATLTVEPGAILFVEGGIENKNGGTIDNDGTIEVQGDFDNTGGTYDGTDPHTVLFSGTTSANVTSNGAIFDQVELNKASGSDITLLDNMTVSGDFNFVADNNKVNLGSNNLVLQSAATVTSADDNEYFVTDGAGAVTKEGLGGTFAFPVGQNATDYNPADLNVTAGTADMSVRVQGTPTDGDGLTGAPLSGNLIDATWEITEANGSVTADVTLEWDTTQEQTDFDPAENGVSKNSGSAWDLTIADVGTSNDLGGGRFNQTRTGVTSFSAFTVGGKDVAASVDVPITAFLEGPYAGPLMDDALRAANQIPLTEPYTLGGFVFQPFGGGETTTAGDLDQPADADDGVDWVFVELRDAADNTNVVASRAAILTRNGEVANEDGSKPVTFHGVAPGNYFIAVKHRNHLGAMTANAVSAASGFNFATANEGTDLFGTDPVTTVGGVNLFRLGDANANSVINTTDLAFTIPGASVGSTNIYDTRDVNMNNVLNATDLTIMIPNATLAPTQQIPN